MTYQTTEADVCRIYVTPSLREVGWDDSPHLISEQHSFTDGRILIVGRTAKRRKQKRADYILRYTRDFPIAVVEAKSENFPAGEGMQQAKDYAETLGLKFAYATNGRTILEFDAFTGIEREISQYPSPLELWNRYQAGVGIKTSKIASDLLTPSSSNSGKQPRYYQEIAINKAVAEILGGNKRLLLTMATGTGKTVVAFQIAWKLWNAKWNAKGENQRKPRILFLADRNILVDDPKDKTFSVFGDARWKIENGEANKGREIYFSTYQSLASDERRPGLYKEYAPDFFDLIIIDECHRGSSRDDSNWREILNYFSPATQLGLTATPLRDESRDTYAYFGNPIYEYSLKQGIEDGFLAPYRVHRIVTTYDATGWRPDKGMIDRYGQLVLDEEYGTKDFERVISLRARTDAVAKNLTDYLKRTDRNAKTIIFCVDQEHADEMRRALSNLNADMGSDYVWRVTSADGDIGRAALARYQELDTTTPTILTTSQLLTTGVDAPTTKNIVLLRVINSMSEFKQIIGRGTRVREDYQKLYFDILDYTGSATQKFADPSFDGDPAVVTEIEINDDGDNLGDEIVVDEDEQQRPQPDDDSTTTLGGNEDKSRKKYYVDGGSVSIVAHLVYEMDSEGNQLRTIQLTDYTGDKVRTLYRDPDELAKVWSNPATRAEFEQQLEERGILLDELISASGQDEADPFDVICNLAFNKPLLTRRQRAQKVMNEQAMFFDQYSQDAKAILSALLDNYMAHGIDELKMPTALQNPPISDYGNASEIAAKFGGAANLGGAVNKLQSLLYAN